MTFPSPGFRAGKSQINNRAIGDTLFTLAAEQKKLREKSKDNETKLSHYPWVESIRTYGDYIFIHMPVFFIGEGICGLCFVCHFSISLSIALYPSMMPFVLLPSSPPSLPLAMTFFYVHTCLIFVFTLVIPTTHHSAPISSSLPHSSLTFHFFHHFSP